MNEINITTQPTQVTYPWKATARTVFQFLMVVIVAFVAAAPEIIKFIETVAPGAPVITVIVSVTAALTALIATIARIMALPQVNALFAAIGLGATPAKTETRTITLNKEN